MVAGTAVLLGSGHRCDQPPGDSRRPVRARIDERVVRRRLGHELSVSRHAILEAEAGSTQVDAPRLHRQPLVERRRAVVADADLGRQRLEATVTNGLIPAGVPFEELDSRHLEPDDERGVMRDPLSVRLGEADLDLRREREAAHERKLYHRGVSVAELAVALRERQPCVVLTGAGISTESGIPDFRSPSGIWAEVDPFEVASMEAFLRDPERVWSFYRTRIRSLLEAEPNAGHHALAELERRGLVQAVVTQNIDTLHSRAGSREVVEIHGSIRSAECLRCHWTQDSAGVLAQLEETPAPLCAHCGEVLKPGVTLFGELLPAGAMERATDLARGAALLLVVGSSLEVWPVAGLPLEARSFAIVNQGSTAFDDRALLTIAASAGETLSAVVAVV
jgi:NAD-dependent deacetylase